MSSSNEDKLLKKMKKKEKKEKKKEKKEKKERKRKAEEQGTEQTSADGDESPPQKKDRAEETAKGNAASSAAESAARIAAAAAAATDPAERKRLKAIAKKKRLKANRQARKRAAAAAGTSASTANHQKNDEELGSIADSIAKKMLKEKRKQQKKAGGGAAPVPLQDDDQERKPNDPNAKFYEKLREKKGPKSHTPWQRHIVFVGQLPFSATKDQIREHFEGQGVEIAGIRMMTDKRTGKFRGTCFLDLPNTRMQSLALRLHHSEFGDGAAKRCINVERTCGGGGKNADRLAKLKEMFVDRDVNMFISPVPPVCLNNYFELSLQA